MSRRRNRRPDRTSDSGRKSRSAPDCFVACLRTEIAVELMTFARNSSADTGIEAAPGISSWATMSMWHWWSLDLSMHLSMRTTGRYSG